MIYIVCGVAGTGKSTVGKLLADRLKLPFYDADDYHSEKNIQKMADGIALNDHDRMKWLKQLSTQICNWERMGGAVLACSALKASYRELLVSCTISNIQWIALEGSEDLILSRLNSRTGHFFSKELLGSQLQIYERPKEGWCFDVSHTVQDIVNSVTKKLIHP